MFLGFIFRRERVGKIFNEAQAILSRTTKSRRPTNAYSVASSYDRRGFYGCDAGSRYLGEAVGSFNAPAYYPYGLAHGGTYIYVFCAGRYLPPFNTIFVVNPDTGAS